MNSTHETRVELYPAPVSDIEAGAEIRFRVGVSCPSGCALVGQQVRLLAADGNVVRDARLTTLEEGINLTKEISLHAPAHVGACEWSVVFSGQSEEKFVHDETSHRIATMVRPHTTSVAVWDVASPLQVGRQPRFKVGVKCSLGCSLAGQGIQVLDGGDALLGAGTLGPTTWPGTAALYWTECQLAAVQAEGSHARTVRFPVPKLDLPHEPAIHVFRVIALRTPERTVTVQVVEKGANTPVDFAEVRMGAYRGQTDAAGFAKLELPKGKHALHVWKEGYALLKETLDVQDNQTLRFEIETAPEPEEEYWM